MSRHIHHKTHSGVWSQGSDDKFTNGILVGLSQSGKYFLHNHVTLDWDLSVPKCGTFEGTYTVGKVVFTSWFGIMTSGIIGVIGISIKLFYWSWPLGFWTLPLVGRSFTTMRTQRCIRATASWALRRHFLLSWWMRKTLCWMLKERDSMWVFTMVLLGCDIFIFENSWFELIWKFWRIPFKPFWQTISGWTAFHDPAALAFVKGILSSLPIFTN